MTATLKYALLSDTKVQLVAKLVTGKSAKDALDMLEFIPKKAAKVLHKLIVSALANAKNNADVKGELFVDQIYVGRGPKIKRHRFASRSKVHAYIKHRSFVRVILQAK